jgi:hypothetical protein
MRRQPRLRSRWIRHGPATKGADTYLQVITWQTAALNNERNDIDIMRRWMEASVVLIEGLGRGDGAQRKYPCYDTSQMMRSSVHLTVSGSIFRLRSLMQDDGAVSGICTEHLLVPSRGWYQSRATSKEKKRWLIWLIKMCIARP